MAEKHGSYYVPEQSIWPIIGAMGLFFFAIGSLNLESMWGVIVCCIGVLTLIFTFIGWFSDVVQESRAGFYDKQMNRTFRWGMAWFLFSEAFFFGILLGALLYIRMSTIPWLAGMGSGGSLLTHYILWPNFQIAWPLINNPNPTMFSKAQQALTVWDIPAINTLILLASAIIATFALWALKKNRLGSAAIGLCITILLGTIFFVSQVQCSLLLITHYNLTMDSGIYGSFLFMLMGFHTVHVVVGLFILLIILLRTIKKHFNANESFGFEAAVWFWNFINVVWVLIFVCVYWV